jgi:predicted permease
MIGRFLRRVTLFARRAQERDALDDEIRLHLDLLEAQERARGVLPALARAAARRRFGNPLVHTEEAREALGLRWLADLRHDVRYALRSLSRERRFAVTALLTLALGTGATTAIFTVVSALVLRPLPFPGADRLVALRSSSAREAIPDIAAYREGTTSFEALSGYEVGARYMRDALGAERVMTVRTEPAFFTILGVPALQGRTYDASDPTSAVVLSERFWRTRFGAAAPGSVIVLDGEPFTVLGVMPASFQFPYAAASLLPGVAARSRTDVWMPFAVPLRGRVGNVVGRLREGVTPGAAEGELQAIVRRLEAAQPARARGRTVRVLPLAEAVLPPEIRRVLFLLFGAVGLVLGLACANVANLFLGRVAARTREVAIRAALGAGRTRLVRQLLTESLVIAVAGGGAGLALAWGATRGLTRLLAPHLPRTAEIGLDWRVFVFLLIVCAATGAVVGIAPALAAARRDTRAALQESEGRTTANRTQRRLRDGLVVMEIAVALVLTVGASVLIRELVRLRQTDSGLQTRNVLTFHVGHRLPLRGEERPREADVRPFLEIEARVARLPGVRAAGFTQLLPLQNWGWASSARDFRVRGEPPQPFDFPIELRFVTPGYFRAHGIPVVRGRGFTDADDRAAPFAIVINETLARRYFGSRSPLGAETTRGTIVGIVGDVRQAHLDRSTEPEVYYTIAQNWSQLSELGMTLVVRTLDRPEASIDAIRSIVREVNPDYAVFNVKTMEQVVAESLSDFTMYLWTIGAFAALALVLAATGTYGVISYVAMARLREFAIRMALGADRTRVMRMVIARGTALAIGGIALGILGALFASPLLAALPVSVRPPGFVTIVPAAAGLVLLAVAATLVPALRAARTDPMTVLRND